MRNFTVKLRNVEKRQQSLKTGENRPKLLTGTENRENRFVKNDDLSFLLNSYGFQCLSTVSPGFLRCSMTVGAFQHFAAAAPAVAAAAAATAAAAAAAAPPWPRVQPTEWGGSLASRCAADAQPHGLAKSATRGLPPRPASPGVAQSLPCPTSDKGI
jgi:hypothetical protein